MLRIAAISKQEQPQPLLPPSRLPPPGGSVLSLSSANRGVGCFALGGEELDASFWEGLFSVP